MNITGAELLSQYRNANARWPFLHNVEQDFTLPPFLLFAVGSRETNLEAAFTTGATGDYGHGHGLFQLDDRWHDIPAGFDTDPLMQAAKAAEMLEVNYRRFGTWDGALNAYNSGSPDVNKTTGKDYGPDVWERRNYLAENSGGRVGYSIDKQMAALEGEIGFREGPNNENPYGRWQGVLNAAYCDSFAQWGAVEHGGYRWPDHCQFGYKGDAYCPYTETHARELGLWRDAATYRQPQRGDQILFDWTGWGGCDHIGTVWGTDDNYATVWCVEGNAGSPQGVHWIKRDWKYIRGFVALSTVAGTIQEEDWLAALSDEQQKELYDNSRFVAQVVGEYKSLFEKVGDGDWFLGLERAARWIKTGKRDWPKR